MRNRGRWKVVAALVSLSFICAGVLAQSQGSVSVGVAEHEELGSYLVDGEGRALYAFTNDEEADEGSACTGECAQAWPPFTAAAVSLDSDELSRADLGTLEREDGTQQVTYDDRPLYYYASDEEPGSVQGQGVNDSWYLVSPDGALVGTDGGDAGADAAQAEEAEGEQADAAQAEEDAAQAEQDAAQGAGEGEAGTAPVVDEDAQLRYTAEQAARGEDAYANSCAKCHGPDMQGSFEAPELAGSNFRNYWGGRSVFELYNFTSTTMPLDAPGSLSEQTYIDLLAHIFQQNGYATNGEPLEADPSLLQELTIPSSD